MKRKRKKNRKIKAKQKRYVNRLWAVKYSGQRANVGRDAKTLLKNAPDGHDSSCVVVFDKPNVYLVDKHGVKTKEFETHLIKHIKRHQKVTIIIGKDDIDACDVSIAGQTISTINNARIDKAIGGDKGVISFVPYGLHHEHLTGFEVECQKWCQKLAEEVPEWWYFLNKEGKPHETAAYWMTANVSERMQGTQKGISKLLATQKVLNSVNNLPNSEEDEQEAIEWLRRQDLLPRCYSFKEGLFGWMPFEAPFEVGYIRKEKIRQE